MNDELISFETAKLAKEKGFTWSTDKCHDVETGNIANTGNVNVNIYSIVGNLAAPTQSLLQRWLREEHLIHIIIHYNKRDTFCVSICDECENSIGELFGEYYKTYEQALEAGLINALNLVK